MVTQLRRAAPFLVALVVFVVALEVLRVELAALTWPVLTTDVLQTPVSRLLLALALTAINYAALTGYDLLAFAYIGHRLEPRRIVATSLLAYAISNTVGFAMLSGASVRFRFYSRWGLTAEQLSRIVVSYSTTFWLGLLGLGGLSLVVTDVPDVGWLPPRAVLVAFGVALLLVPILFLGMAARGRAPLTLGRLTLPMPTLRIAAGQVVVSCLDWALAGAVLYVLLPPGAPGFLPFLGAFLVAILLGMVSHVPGGLGVFEGLMVLLLRPFLSSGELMPALVVFRVVYYLGPLGLGLLALIGDEMLQRRAHLSRVARVAGRLTEELSPRALSVLTFFTGWLLLVSGATPAADGRLQWLHRLLPVGVIEASHFLASIAGAALLILSQGVARRLDAAYYATSAVLLTGMLTTLVKGGDYEEAVLVLLTLGVLWRSRPAFDRRARFFDTRFTGEWLAAVAGATLATVWLGFFAFKHVDFSNDLWWQFELHGDASRFLRASVGVAIVFVLVAVARLLAPHPHDAPLPTDTDLDDAARVIAAQSATAPYLAYLRDKALLFTPDRSAFLMYAVQGRTWVAMGDPVGPSARWPELVRAFLERCDDFGGTPVFYEIGASRLHLYADAGLTFVKLGEEARVDLSRFTLAGGAASRYRQALRRLDKDGGVFRVVPPEHVATILPELRAVSDEWLTAKAVAEKGFSLGFFDETYLLRFPVAVVERNGRIEAFANLWCSADRHELSVDLMRYRHDAPKCVMEALFVHLLQWGHREGYGWFSLGMAPLSGFAASPVASLWTRLGSFLYEHADAIYNFQGLRAYKDKFDPIWTPHYLAYPGGLRLARVMADVSALVAGGYRHIFVKDTRPRTPLRCAAVEAPAQPS